MSGETPLARPAAGRGSYKKPALSFENASELIFFLSYLKNASCRPPSTVNGGRLLFIGRHKLGIA
jgi:hypothetical protein